MPKSKTMSLTLAARPLSDVLPLKRKKVRIEIDEKGELTITAKGKKVTEALSRWQAVALDNSSEPGTFCAEGNKCVLVFSIYPEK